MNATFVVDVAEWAPGIGEGPKKFSVIFSDPV